MVLDDPVVPDVPTNGRSDITGRCSVTNEYQRKGGRRGRQAGSRS